jgi:hypothetical protein
MHPASQGAIHIINNTRPVERLHVWQDPQFSDRITMDNEHETIELFRCMHTLECDAQIEIRVERLVCVCGSNRCALEAGSNRVPMRYCIYNVIQA